MTEAEVQELAEAHTGLTASEHDPANGYYHGCCRSCGEAMPCPTVKLLAERREREAKLAELLREAAREREVHREAEAELAARADDAYDKRNYAEQCATTLSLKLGEAEAKLTKMRGLIERLRQQLHIGSRDPRVEDFAVKMPQDLWDAFREALADPPIAQQSPPDKG